METGQNSGTNQREVIAGIKIVESLYRVERPVYEDVRIEKPIYVDKQIEVPVGIEKVLITLVDDIVVRVLEKLDGAIVSRLKEIEVPKIIYKEELNIITKDIEVNNAVVTDVQVKNAVLQDVIVKNPIIEDVPVINAVLIDQTVHNAVFKDRIVINPIFEDVVIQRPKFVEKEIVVIHPKYIDMKGNPE